MRSRGLLSLFLVAGLALAACGDDDGEAVGPSITSTPLETDSASEAPTPTAEPTETASATETESEIELAGEPYDGPPVSGQAAELAVVGVAADDVLNVRAAPGTDQSVIATLEPLTTGLQATGRGRLLPSSIWVEVDIDGELGWVSSSFVGYVGAAVDITSEIVSETGDTPTAETLTQLAEEIAALRSSEDPESRVVISGGPDVGDLGEVTVDVVGLGDDAQLGWRLVIFATEDEGGESFTLKSVEAIVLCGRGVDGDACV